MTYVPPPRRKHYAQLAKNLEQIPEKKRGLMFPGLMSPKKDGVFMFAVCIGGTVTFLSRTGELVLSPKNTQIERDIKAIHVASWCDFVLIGEFYLDGVEQAEISGVFRKQVEGYAGEVEFHVHDKLTVQEFEQGSSDRPYSLRVASLTAMFSGLELEAVVQMEQRLCENELTFVAYARDIQRAGGEGAIYRPHTAKWVAGDRSTNLVRIKQEISYDLEVVGITDVKEGPKGGLLGAIQVRFRRGGDPAGDPIVVDVRGMGHDDLRAWAANPSLIVGKIAKVTAMRLTNLGSLREPRFKEIRFDKENPDL